MKPEQIIEKKLGREALDIWRFLLRQKPRKSETLVFLQGDRLDRVHTTLTLYKQELAKKIFITGNNHLAGRGKHIDENDISIDQIKKVFLKKGVSVKNIIIDDQAFNTKDQAVNVIKMAVENNWKNILVVTSPYHLLRAYLTFVKRALVQKWAGKTIMCVADLDWHKIPSGRSKTALEMLIIEMEKIKKYKRNIATIKQCLNHIQNN